MFNMGMTEMLIIGAIALIVIGPKKLPGLARAVGKGITEFRKAAGDFKGVVTEEFQETTNDPEIRDLAKMAENLKNMRNPKNIEDYLETAASVLEGADKTAEDGKRNGETTTDEYHREKDSADLEVTYPAVDEEKAKKNKTPDEDNSISKS